MQNCEHCNFNEKLEEHLRDRFVCGLNDERIQQKLLAMSDLNLKKCIDTAIAMEAAVISAKQIHSSGAIANRESQVGEVHKFDQSSKKNQGRKECSRCGSFKHLGDACFYKTKPCFACKQTGHHQRKCSSNKAVENNNNRRQGAHHVHFAEGASAPEDNKTNDVLEVSDKDYYQSGINFMSLYKLNVADAEEVLEMISPEADEENAGDEGVEEVLEVISPEADEEDAGDEGVEVVIEVISPGADEENAGAEAELQDSAGDEATEVYIVPDDEVPGDVVDIYALEDEKSGIDPVMVNLKLNEVEVSMEVDTGASYTCISSDLY